MSAAEICRAGRKRVIEHIASSERLQHKRVETLADAALAAAKAQTVTVPSE